MGITNIELDKRIKDLEKRIIQNKEPVNGSYKGQTWFDEVSGQMKYWDGKDYVSGESSGGGELKIKTGYSAIPSGYTDFAITGVGFTPKAITVVVVEPSSNKVAWGYADNVGGTIGQRTIYADSGNYETQDGRLFRFDNTNRGSLVSFDANGFTVKSTLSAIMIWTCFG